MDITQNPAEQLEALSAFLRRIAENKTPVSKDMWELEMVEGMIEHADFLDRYTTPKVQRLLSGEKLTLRAPVPRIADYTPAVPALPDLEIRDDDSSATLIPPRAPVNGSGAR